MRSSTSPPPALQLSARVRAITHVLHIALSCDHERVFAILMAEKMSGTSVKISKNEVGCRDDTVPKTVETRRHCKNTSISG